MLRSYLKRAPFYLWPVIPVYGFIAGTLLYIYYALVHWTCRIDYQHPPQAEGPKIYLMWHRHFSLYFSSVLRFRGHAWINHPLPYMAPWYFLAQYFGISVMIPGSTGHDGREAANELVKYIKQGYSTGITPDGPAGPPMVLKKGALHIAQQSNAPIVALQFSYSRCLVLPTWDRKVIPVPFVSKICVHEAEPVHIDKNSFESQIAKLTKCLNEAHKLI